MPYRTLCKVAYMTTPGQRIKEEREKQGLSQQSLAESITRIKREKISRASISQWESGSSKTQKPENFFAAAEALGLVPKWVLSGEGIKYQKDFDQNSKMNQEIIDLALLESPLPIIPNMSIFPEKSDANTKRSKRIFEITRLLEDMDDEGLLVVLTHAKLAAKDHPATNKKQAS